MKATKDLKAVNTIEDLENLVIGAVDYEIGYRGGHCGFRGVDVAEHFEVSEYHLPIKFGAFCNYLGGGMRGSICGSGFSNKIAKRKAKLLIELENACKRVYENIENYGGLNDDEDEGGEINWDTKATKGARNAGIKSAY